MDLNSDILAPTQAKLIKANQLFIVCPFSCMETFLQHKYGNDIFFLTFSVSVLQYQQFEYVSEIKQFIKRERIKTIYIVNDTSCRFINGIIMRKKLSGLPSEKVIEELYIEHYFSDFKDKSLFYQQGKMAELNIRKQLIEMANSSLLENCIAEFNIELKGLITSKEKKLYKEIRLNNNNIIYEL